MSEEDSVECNKEALEAIQQQWIPDTLNDVNINPLQSFEAIKRKTMRDLYEGDGHDKSPKGSVDSKIRPLVNLINAHPCFATLSSCSGRIALFDPHHKENDDDDDDRVEKALDASNHTTTEHKSGKGQGAWLLASHEVVEPWTLVNLLDEPGEAREILIFKHEPLLLHVAASSLTRGRQLLALALRLGFRESGLVISQHRVTVAIRSHSLILNVPLARQGPLRPSPAFLESLIKEANLRMQSNQAKLKRLYGAVQGNLFRRAENVAPPQKVLCAAVTELPRLNLWGHAAVAVAVGTMDDVDVIVFGGYGQGPELEGSNKSGKSNRCGRSNSVHSLRRRNGAFESHWRHVRQIPVIQKSQEPSVMSSLGVEVVPVDFSAREGLAACVLPSSNSAAAMSVVALFGGRSSPSKPFCDLLLYEPFAVSPAFVKPTMIRGQAPEPRWGHTLTALSGTDGLMAVVVGGRNEKTTFGSLHILTLVKSDDWDTSHFHWASLDLELPARFQHTTVSVNDSVFVFGGISNISDLLSSFADSPRPLSNGETNSQPGICGFDVDSQGVALFDEKDVGGDSMSSFGGSIGGASCVIKAPNASGETQTLIALTGGVPSSSTASQTIQWCQVISTDKDDDAVALVPRHDITIDKSEEKIDFGSMVHHCCIPLPGDSEFALVGGGVSSFAFGPSFAE